MTLTEPRATDPRWPRYSTFLFSPYRYVPGLNSHPRTHPEGHSCRRPEVVSPFWAPEEWRTLEIYLAGIDLYNFAYWWESHEAFEALWRAAEKSRVKVRFIQGIIQIAAAHLHRHMGRRSSALGQAEKGLGNLRCALGEGPIFMGIEVVKFSRGARSYFYGNAIRPALIELRVDIPE